MLCTYRCAPVVLGESLFTTVRPDLFWMTMFSKVDKEKIYTDGPLKLRCTPSVICDLHRQNPSPSGTRVHPKFPTHPLHFYSFHSGSESSRPQDTYPGGTRESCRSSRRPQTTYLPLGVEKARWTDLRVSDESGPLTSVPCRTLHRVPRGLVPTRDGSGPPPSVEPRTETKGPVSPRFVCGSTGTVASVSQVTDPWSGPSAKNVPQVFFVTRGSTSNFCSLHRPVQVRRQRV